MHMSGAKLELFGNVTHSAASLSSLATFLLYPEHYRSDTSMLLGSREFTQCFIAGGYLPAMTACSSWAVVPTFLFLRNKPQDALVDGAHTEGVSVNSILTELKPADSMACWYLRFIAKRTEQTLSK